MSSKIAFYIIWHTGGVSLSYPQVPSVSLSPRYQYTYSDQIVYIGASLNGC